MLALLCSAVVWVGAMAQDESDISKLQLGMQAGVGYVVTAGSLHDNFKGGVEFTAGLTADYSRVRLKADVSYCQPGFNNVNMWGLLDENGRDKQINANTSATQLSLGVQLGYKVWQGRRVSVTPAAGMFYSRYSWGLADITWDKDEEGKEFFKVNEQHDIAMGNVSWMASVDVDVKLHERVTTEPFFLNQRYSRLSTHLRISPWIAGGRLKDTAPSKKGVYAGITLRLTGFMQSLGF